MNFDWVHIPKNMDWLHMPTNLDFLLSPITQYALCSLCLGASLLLWLSFKKELQAVRLNSRKSYDQLHENVQELSTSVETIRENWRPTAPSPVPASEVSQRGFAFTSRAEVLRMYGRREPLQAIASSLRLPVNEVDFLVKVERLLNPEKASHLSKG